MLGQDPVVSALTAKQVQMLLPSVLFQGQFDLWKRWLACQRCTVVPMLCMVVGALLHLPLCWLFACHLQLGVKGLAISSGIKDAVLLLTVMVFSS
mmetsp:Transcript_29730/g.36897  ORF Transcript_29730/g.36897 Transcript_29730/m.36897 type:complete len:95 (-) Transcript_29730:834-1118(-)